MGSGLQRTLKYALIRGTQSARSVRGQARSPWVRRFYRLLAPVYDFTLLNLPGYRRSAQDLLSDAVRQAISWEEWFSEPRTPAGGPPRRRAHQRQC